MSNLVSLYVNELPRALKALYPSLLPTQITIGYQKATTVHDRFIVWGFQQVAQQVFTGTTEARGVDTPIFNFNIYARRMLDAAALADTMIDSWNGFSGELTPNLIVNKLQVIVNTSAYDEEDSFHRIELDLKATVTVQV